MMPKERIQIVPSAPVIDGDGQITPAQTSFTAFPAISSRANQEDATDLRVETIGTTADGLLLIIIADNLQEVIAAKPRNAKGQFTEGKSTITEISPFTYQVRIITDPVSPTVSSIDLMTRKYAPEVRDDVPSKMEDLVGKDESDDTLVEPGVTSAEVKIINDKPILQLTIDNPNSPAIWEMKTAYDYLHRGQVSPDKTSTITREMLLRGTNTVFVPVYFDSWTKGFVANISISDRTRTIIYTAQMVIEKQTIVNDIAAPTDMPPEEVKHSENRISDIIPPLVLSPGQIIEVSDLKQQILRAAQGSQIEASSVRSITMSSAIYNQSLSPIADDELVDFRQRLRAQAPGKLEMVARIDCENGETFLATFRVLIRRVDDTAEQVVEADNPYNPDFRRGEITRNDDGSVSIQVTNNGKKPTQDNSAWIVKLLGNVQRGQREYRGTLPALAPGESTTINFRPHPSDARVGRKFSFWIYGAIPTQLELP